MTTRPIKRRYAFEELRALVKSKGGKFFCPACETGRIQVLRDTETEKVVECINGHRWAFRLSGLDYLGSRGDEEKAEQKKVKELAREDTEGTQEAPLTCPTCGQKMPKDASALSEGRPSEPVSGGTA